MIKSIKLFFKCFYLLFRPLFKGSLKLGQKYKNIFVGFLVQMKTLKFAFEINGPLVRASGTRGADLCDLVATPVPSKHLVILSPPSRFFSIPLALLASTYVLCNANYPLTYNKLLLSSKEIFVLTGFSAIFLLAVGVITRLAAPQGLLDKAAMVAAAAAAARRQAMLLSAVQASECTPHQKGVTHSHTNTTTTMQLRHST